jgi:hypothetical protein
MSEGTSAMISRASKLRNCTVSGPSGEAGKLRDVYFDDHTWKARYLILDTGGWPLGGRQLVLPPAAIVDWDPTEGKVSVALSQEQIESCPVVGESGASSREEQDAWERHFGMSGAWGALQVQIPVAEPPKDEPSAAPPKLAGAPAESQLWSSAEVTDYALAAEDGDIGRVQDFLVDSGTWTIRFVVVLRSWLAGTETLLPPLQIRSVDTEEMKVFVGVTRDAVLNAPVWDGLEPIGVSYEQAIQRHYGSVVT